SVGRCLSVPVRAPVRTFPPRIGHRASVGSRRSSQQGVDNNVLMSESGHMHSDALRTEARRTLRTAGADALPHMPWQHPDAPPEDSTLLRFAVDRAGRRDGRAGVGELRAALRLLDSARSDPDSLEAALLLTARAEGLTWAQIAEDLGLRSAQAAQQRSRRAGAGSPSEASPADPRA